MLFKKNKLFRTVITIGLLLILLFSLAACTGGAENNEKVLTLADAQWDSIRVHNAIVGVIAKECYGYTSIKEVSSSTPITFTALKNGEIDVYTELWQENIASYQTDLKDGKFVELGINFSDNAQGFYVPRFVIEGDKERGIEAVAPDLKTVADLDKYADVFVDPENAGKGRIMGAIPGWEVDNYCQKVVENYGLLGKYNYASPGSEPALAASIKSACEKGEPWVGYYWEPTYISGKYDIVRLTDVPYSPELWEQGKCDFPSNNVTVGVSNAFAQKDPELIEMLKNYSTSSDMTAKAIAYMTDNKADFTATAKWFITKYKDQVLSWLPEDKAKTLNDAIADWDIKV